MMFLPKMPKVGLAVMLQLLIFLAGCSGTLIRSGGLRGARLGHTFPPKKVKFDYLSSRDSLQTEDRFTWPTRIYTTDSGRIKLEGDFEGGNTLNRVIVEDARFQTRKGIHVGSTLADLKKQYADLRAVPLPNYRLLEIYALSEPRVLYMVKVFPPPVYPDGTVNLEVLEDSLPVLYVVVQ